MKKEEKKTLKELWEDKRSHAAIVLGLWVVFILILIVYMGIADALTPKRNITPNVPSSSTETFADFSLMKEALMKDNYAYTCEVKQGENNIVFQGKKNASKEVGYKETLEGIIKYEKTENMTYQILLEQKIELPNLYDGLREDFLNSKTILNQISLLRKNEISNDDYKIYNYQATEEDITYTISVTMNKKAITKIVVDHPSGMYTMKFTNIEEITEENIYE